MPRARRSRRPRPSGSPATVAPGPPFFKALRKVVIAGTVLVVVMTAIVGGWLWYLIRSGDKTTTYRRMNEEHLKEAIAKDPTLYGPHEYLGRLYGSQSHDAGDPAKRSRLARASLSEYRRAYELDAPASRSYLLESLGWAAYRAGDVGAVRQYASRMLDKQDHDWDFGNKVHHAHTLLGLVALDHGDIAAAERELALAGATPGSPQLDSFGPQMSLARALLLKNRRESVVRYFAQCGKFWRLDWGKLKSWTKLAQAGEMPAFGANLVYE